MRGSFRIKPRNCGAVLLLLSALPPIERSLSTQVRIRRVGSAELRSNQRDVQYGECFWRRC
jgi:hypothetical protein